MVLYEITVSRAFKLLSIRVDKVWLEPTQPDMSVDMGDLLQYLICFFVFYETRPCGHEENLFSGACLPYDSNKHPDASDLQTLNLCVEDHQCRGESPTSIYGGEKGEFLSKELEEGEIVTGRALGML